MKYNFGKFKKDLEKVEKYLDKVYRELNIGRATPMVLDSISIESYGSMQPLKNVASISVEDPKTLRINPWDKEHIKLIEKAISIADLGLSTSVDDTGLRVIFPQLTTENREKLTKIIKEKLEEARISVRKARQNVLDEMGKIEKEGDLTEDEKKRAKEDLQRIVDEINKNLEDKFKKKEQEVLN